MARGEAKTTSQIGKSELRVGWSQGSQTHPINVLLAPANYMRNGCKQANARLQCRGQR